MDELFSPNPEFVERINNAQNSWTATVYPDMTQYTMGEWKYRSGSPWTVASRPRKHVNQLSPELSALVNDLPKQFDWRFRPDNQPDPITPVRNQGACGSCYIFASAAALESRIRLATNFTLQPILSPQDVIDCNPYAQGCQGGFPYLTGGKYGQVFGFVEESCVPYHGLRNETCHTPTECKRFYTTDYGYVGGFYGASNEQNMMLELFHHGPIPVGFEVHDDFKHYKSGVYHHTGFEDSRTAYHSFEIINHAVLLVGYGIDNRTREPFWTLKNSWGPAWGEEGFFRILRGKDECGIESYAVRFDPIL